jgi:hypothetical protein
MHGLIIVSEILLSVMLVVASVAAMNGKRMRWSFCTPASTEDRTYSLWPVVVVIAVLFLVTTVLLDD